RAAQLPDDVAAAFLDLVHGVDVPERRDHRLPRRLDRIPVDDVVAVVDGPRPVASGFGQGDVVPASPVPDAIAPGAHLLQPPVDHGCVAGAPVGARVDMALLDVG